MTLQPLAEFILEFYDDFKDIHAVYLIWLCALPILLLFALMGVMAIVDMILGPWHPFFIIVFSLWGILILIEQCGRFAAWMGW